MFLVSFPKGPGCLPYVFLITGYVTALETVYNPTFAVCGVLVLGLHEDLFMVVLPLKCTWIPYLPQICLKLLAIPLVYDITTWPIVDLLAGEGIGCLVPWWLLSCVVLWLSASVIIAIPSLLLLVLFCSGGMLSLWSPQLLFNTLFCTLFMAKGGNCTFLGHSSSVVILFEEALSLCKLFWPYGLAYLWHYT